MRVMLPEPLIFGKAIGLYTGAAPACARPAIKLSLGAIVGSTVCLAGTALLLMLLLLLQVKLSMAVTAPPAMRTRVGCRVGAIGMLDALPLLQREFVERLLHLATAASNPAGHDGLRNIIGWRCVTHGVARVDERAERGSAGAWPCKWRQGRGASSSCTRGRKW